MGIISSASSKVDLGLELAGIVLRVGRKVQNLTVGTRVFALAPHGCISNTAVIPSKLCIGIPGKLSYDHAATMPICFTTAIHSLMGVGQLNNCDVSFIIPLFLNSIRHYKKWMSERGPNNSFAAGVWIESVD